MLMRGVSLPRMYPSENESVPVNAHGVALNTTPVAVFASTTTEMGQVGALAGAGLLRVRSKRSIYPSPFVSRVIAD